MKPTLHGDSRVLSAYLTILILLGIASYGWWKRVDVAEERVCGICSAESYHTTTYIYGHAVASWDTAAKPGEDTRNYFDRYLGYPHAHEWAEGLDFSGYPTMVYQLVAASGIPDAEGRRRYFEYLIRPSGKDHSARVVMTWMAINGQFFRRTPDHPKHREIWSPDMEGVVIPAEVKAGGLLPAAP